MGLGLQKFRGLRRKRLSPKPHILYSVVDYQSPDLEGIGRALSAVVILSARWGPCVVII